MQEYTFHSVIFVIYVLTAWSWLQMATERWSIKSII